MRGGTVANMQYNVATKLHTQKQILQKYPAT